MTTTDRRIRDATACPLVHCAAHAGQPCNRDGVPLDELHLNRVRLYRVEHPRGRKRRAGPKPPSDPIMSLRVPVALYGAVRKKGGAKWGDWVRGVLRREVEG